MPNLDPERLRAIKTLPQLLTYLRNDLDWPIENEDVEDLTFDYQPGELGLDAAAAVKIKEIKQLRPLTGQQPWGIFWVNFEKKRLPVVIMRRILRALVLKKRGTANAAERKAWQPSDLLFISAYGEDTDRAITFAHFVEHEDHSNLAELRVLGWDDDDTPLKYDYILHTLHDKLHWRDDFARDADFWRKTWRAAFTLCYREVITTSKELALALAGLAKRIRGRVRTILRYEDGFGQIRKLQRAFQQGLIHDLTDDDFADMLAQTVTYGLFSVACRRTFPGLGTAIVRDDVPDLIITSPFLKEMLGIFLGIKTRKGKLDFDELGVTDVEDLLRSPDTHMEAVLRDFGNKTRQEDPVIHFYELFLTEYDKQRKIQRGVFYTPQPVVTYIVRSVHELLQTEFGLEDGLASTITWGEMVKLHPDLKLPLLTDEPKETRTISPDEPFVQILDPAIGTGTFAVEVIDVIHKTMVAKWSKLGKSAAEISKLWNEYVPQNLLPRLYGYELMMAPYAIAHMKIGLKLSETGYRFGSEERARIYLTNALEPRVKQLPSIGFEALAHEAKEVNEVKWYKRFTVVVGNPPYSYMSANLTPAAATLIEPFRYVDGERIREKSALSLERSLQDDFVKFFGLALRLRRETGPSFVLGFITNNSYMDSALHRGVRGELTFLLDRLYLINLFGDSIKDREENVFDIQQGVAVFLGVKMLGDKDAGTFVVDIHGSRIEKYAAMQQQSWKTTDFAIIKPAAPQRYFLNLETGGEYPSFPALTDMFLITSTCIKTLKDALATGFDAEQVRNNIEYFIDAKTSKEEIKERFGVEDVVQWRIETARRAVRGAHLNNFITPYQARPFDYRQMFYHNAIIGSPRTQVMRNLLKTKNIALIANRKIRTGECHHFWVSSRICVSEIISSADNSNCFPLHVLADEHGLRLGNDSQPNLSSSFLKQLGAALGLTETDTNLLPAGLTAEDIFGYAYAVFHSPGYRTRYAGFLKIDFPRLPLTSSLEMFRALAKLGGELVAMHLMESPKLDRHITKWSGGKNPEVEKVTYSDNTVWTDKAQTTGFRGVPENVWNFHIGGYQVCEKWLKDRKGRTLTKDDIAHYQKIVVALSETIHLMAEIDQVIEKHGGWPGAFQQEKR